MIAKGTSTLTLQNIMMNMTELDILSYYLNIYNVPTVIPSPIRKDEHPSFGFYSKDGNRIYYNDFATRDKGGLFDLLGIIWNCSYNKVLERIANDKNKILNHKTSHDTSIESNKNSINQNCYMSHANIDLEVKVRNWLEHDIKYWESYGISLKWLKWAEVYPISHKIVIKNSNRYVFSADKYAYVYVEHKEGITKLKIYQPFNKKGYKWSSKFDGSVISLWTKIPQRGDIIVICSSLKDALCLSANTNIPAISPQGEGYSMSKTAIDNLKTRFKKIYICFDSDEAGRIASKKLSQETGFINAELPCFEGGKDLSDYYFLHGKLGFLKLSDNLFSSSFVKEKSTSNELPF